MLETMVQCDKIFAGWR